MMKLTGKLLVTTFVIGVLGGMVSSAVWAAEEDWQNPVMAQGTLTRFNPFTLKTFSVAEGAAAETDLMSLAAIECRPSIRIPYRPPLRSPFRPYLDLDGAS